MLCWLCDFSLPYYAVVLVVWVLSLAAGAGACPAGSEVAGCPPADCCVPVPGTVGAGGFSGVGSGAAVCSGSG